MNRLRVMQLVTGVAVGAEVGGAELFGIQLARYLDKKAFDAMVCGLWCYDSPREKEWLEQLESEGVRVRLLAAPTGQLLPDIRHALSQFWREVSAFRPQVINSHSERCDVFNLLAHALHPVRPRAVRAMGVDQQWQRRPWVGAALSQVLYPIGFSAEVGNSRTICEVLDARLFARLIHKRSILCYNGIDENILGRGNQEGKGTALPHGVPARGPRIGTVGRLTEQKGYADLLDAMHIVRQSAPAELLIIGSGQLETTLRQKTARLGLQDCVHFLGSRGDVEDILPYFDVIVSSSWWEGFPTVLLQALAAGVPVVATDVSGSRELVRTGETGILVPTHNPARLAEAIVTLLRDPIRARTMAEAARQSAAPFTLQNAAKTYADIYRRIIRHT